MMSKIEINDLNADMPKSEEDVRHALAKDTEQVKGGPHFYTWDGLRTTQFVATVETPKL